MAPPPWWVSWLLCVVCVAHAAGVPQVDDVVFSRGAVATLAATLAWSLLLLTLPRLALLLSPASASLASTAAATSASATTTTTASSTSSVPSSTAASVTASLIAECGYPLSMAGTAALAVAFRSSSTGSVVAWGARLSLLAVLVGLWAARLTLLLVTRIARQPSHYASATLRTPASVVTAAERGSGPKRAVSASTSLRRRPTPQAASSPVVDVALARPWRLGALLPFMYLTVWTNGASLWLVFGTDGAPSQPLAGWDAAGSVLVVSGLVAALLADCQGCLGHLGRFRRPAQTLPPVAYVGEMAVFWGFFLCSVPVLLDQASGWWWWVTLLAPLHVTAALLFFAGILPPRPPPTPRYSWGLGMHMVVTGEWCSGCGATPPAH